MTGFDLWQLSMYYTYGSLAGICNLVFTAAMIALTWNKWGAVTAPWRLLMLIACCWFPLIQPLLIYKKVKRQAEQISQDTEISFSEHGIDVKVGDETSHTAWSDVKRVSKKPTMLIVFPDTRHGFVLPGRELNEEKEKLYDYLSSKIS